MPPNTELSCKQEYTPTIETFWVKSVFLKQNQTWPSKCVNMHPKKSGQNEQSITGISFCVCGWVVLIGETDNGHVRQSKSSRVVWKRNRGVHYSRFYRPTINVLKINPLILRHNTGSFLLIPALKLENCNLDKQRLNSAKAKGILNNKNSVPLLV